MSFVLQPWQFLLAVLCGIISERQQRVIEFQNAQINVLMQKLGRKRFLLNDDQRRLIATKGHALGRKVLRELTTIVTPDTMLRWHRTLVARKWDHSHKRQAVGRPRIRQEIVDLILKFATENPAWGYDRIQGALANVGFRISDTTVANVLKANGIEPAPDRQRSLSWSTFLKAHWESLFATDFTTVEVWTRSGLVTFYVMAVMHLKTRRVQIAGITTTPDSAWMTQVCRQLTDGEDGFLRDASHLLVDRDRSFIPLRRHLKQHTETDVALLPPNSPNLNAHIERFFGSLKRECLDRMTFFGRRSLENAIGEYAEHYHAERNHQRLGNELIEPDRPVGVIDGQIECVERLGGMLKHYRRAA